MKFKVVLLIAVLAFLSMATTASTLPASSTPQVVSKTKTTTKRVAHRTKRGGKWVYTTSRVKSRPARHKTWRTGRKVVSRTKKIFS